MDVRALFVAREMTQLRLGYVMVLFGRLWHGLDLVFPSLVTKLRVYRNVNLEHFWITGRIAAPRLSQTGSCYIKNHRRLFTYQARGRLASDDPELDEKYAGWKLQRYAYRGAVMVTSPLTLTFPNKIKEGWRRRRDSNPRYPLPGMAP